jgi:hypothetical protein
VEMTTTMITGDENNDDELVERLSFMVLRLLGNQ